MCEITHFILLIMYHFPEGFVKIFFKFRDFRSKMCGNWLNKHSKYVFYVEKNSLFLQNSNIFYRNVDFFADIC